MQLILRQGRKLTAREWEQLWTFTSEFVEVERNVFEALVRGRSYMALVYADRGRTRLVGTSGITIERVSWDGRDVVMLYTSDVLLHPTARGRNVLQRIGAWSYVRTRARYPLRPIYWFLGASSTSAYLLLARNLATFWPHPARTTPSSMLRLRDAMARTVMADRWDAEQGVFRVAGVKRLRDAQAARPPRHQPDAFMTYFEQQNPAHAEGDALGCLAPLNTANWLSIAHAAWQRRLAKRYSGALSSPSSPLP